jgi:hypothetical protein
MIDTDKYEGRSKRTAWRTSTDEPYFELNWLKDNDECNEADVQVLADAPLLLAEVKRLRENNKKLHSRCMYLENLLEEWQGAYE